MDEEAPAMESMRWVGVDVHAKESLAAVLDQATEEISTQRITGRPGEAVVEWLATVAQPFRAAYEAGPTGYGLGRSDPDLVGRLCSGRGQPEPRSAERALLLLWKALGPLRRFQKVEREVNPVPFSFLNALEDGRVALGCLRVSHRELDLQRSTPEQPWHTHRREERLKPGEAMRVEIEIWPAGTRFRASEQLRPLIQGRHVQQSPRGVVSMAPCEPRNAGAYVIRAGGRFDSHMLVPVGSRA
jgi:predicted acyl esterase